MSLDNQETKEVKSTETSSTDNSKICAVLAYFAIGIIWYFLDEKMKKDEFAKFHVKQALGLIIADLVLMTALGASIIGIPFIVVVKVFALVFSIMGIINALNGDKKELPIIGSYSIKYLKF